MKLIIGLGNPTKQYENTRHNVGFMILDRIKEIAHFSEFQKNEKFNALISEGKNAEDEKVLLVKPYAFMNLSGSVTKKIADFYKIPATDITVIHDDLDIELGKYKISVDSSAAGHNGVQNIFDEFSTQQIKRVRVGIEGPERKKDRLMSGADFVLQNFSDEEIKVLKLTTEDIKDTGITGGIAFDLGL
jgi:PTH1 family peptidyl-tRNA hydrolase